MYKGECDVSKCEKLEQHLLSEYGHIKREVIGHSTLGREIIAYTVGGDSGVLYCGAFHGMERITATMLYKFLEDVCIQRENNREFSKLIDRSGATVVPMMNPDSVEISIHGAHTALDNKSLVEECLCRAGVSHTRWQANANGVDINHNFDAGFESVKNHERQMGITQPSPTRYGGEYPESECETKALCDFCRAKNFKTAVALHTQGREIYYDFSDNTPKESEDIAHILSELSGYAVSHPEGIAVGGGFKDWFIDYFHRPAFTLEIGEGVNPLSPDVFYTEYDRVSKMLFYLLSI